MRKKSFTDFIKDYPNILHQNNNINQKDINNKINPNVQFNSEINNLKQKNIELENEIKILKSKLNKYENENNRLKNDIKNSENEINILKNENIVLNTKLNLIRNIIVNDSKDEIISLMKQIQIKDNIIIDLSKKQSNDIKEELMTVIFTTFDQKFHYALICKHTDEFHMVENELYKIYPEYIETENYFTARGNKINKYKTMDENNIKFSEIIILNQFE